LTRTATKVDLRKEKKKNIYRPRGNSPRGKKITEQSRSLGKKRGLTNARGKISLDKVGERSESISNVANRGKSPGLKKRHTALWKGKEIPGTYERKKTEFYRKNGKPARSRKEKRDPRSWRALSR